jgi:hypothetical protein
MKKIFLITICVLIYSCKTFSQDITGKWKIILTSNPDTETYSDVYWEFTSDKKKCIERMLDDDSVVDTYLYTLSNLTCDDGVQDKDIHLSLISLKDGFKRCFVFDGMDNINGRVTMAITSYEEAEPILFVKEHSNTYQLKHFTKNDCATGGLGDNVSYEVIAGKYTSTISQADADKKALDEVNANGQANANAKGGCTFKNKALVNVSFTRNNCLGKIGTTVLYSLQAGWYTSKISQVDSDNQAKKSGQDYANRVGICK